MNESEHSWYFAYGSNMESGTFCGRRGIEYTRSVPARLTGWRLVLDKPPLLPIGESFANLVPDPEAEALGVLYEITREALEHVCLTEGVAIGNYRCVEVVTLPLSNSAAITATTLVSDQRAPELKPSARYMASLISGAEQHGLPAEYVAHLRGLATCDESVEARLLRPLLDRAMRRR